ncbi:MAG TPA: extracellular solute-binding protein [Alphaproteobacteria bacterium]|jgi:iron(III) transport system substrate-binding protein
MMKLHSRILAAALVSTATLLSVGVAQAQDRSWMDPTLLAAAKKEGKVAFYASINEEEGLPLLKIFEDATGIKVDYVRNSDSGLLSRIMVETRAGKQSWDVIQTTAVNKMPQDFLLKYEPPEAKNLMEGARDPNGKWYGVYANYNTPAYNTTKIKAADLPKTYEELATKKDWAGKIAIDYSDNEWVVAMYKFYGDVKGAQVVKDIVAGVKPVIAKGHLGLARSVGAGEYSASLNNYLNLTLNVKLSGGPIDYWIMDPVAVFYGQVGINAKAPSPNAAKLLSNFMLSKEGQTAFTAKGRIPTRADVETNPPGLLKALEGHKIIPVILSPEEEAKWQKVYKEQFDVR